MTNIQIIHVNSTLAANIDDWMRNRKPKSYEDRETNNHFVANFRQGMTAEIIVHYEPEDVYVTGALKKCGEIVDTIGRDEIPQFTGEFHFNHENDIYVVEVAPKADRKGNPELYDKYRFQLDAISDMLNDPSDGYLKEFVNRLYLAVDILQEYHPEDTKFKTDNKLFRNFLMAHSTVQTYVRRRKRYNQALVRALFNLSELTRKFH